MPARRTLFLIPLLASLASAALLALPTPAQAWEWSWSWSGSGPSLVGSGKVVEEARTLPAFTRIRLDGPFNLRATQAAATSVGVRADDNLVQRVITEVEGDTLVVSLRPGHSLRSREPLQVSVGTSSLQGVDMRGSGDLWLQSLKGERFELQLSGSGDARLSGLALRSLVVGVSGSGDVTAQGRCDEAQLSIAGSGDLHMAELQTLRTSVSIAGSGDARVHATQALSASVAGSGDVRYSGSPPQLKSSVAGSGSVLAVR